jgi:integrase
MEKKVEVSIYRLEDGKFQTSFVDPVLNKRIRAKFKFFNEAKAYQKNTLNQHRNANFVANSTTPLGEFIPGYLVKYPRAKMFSRSPHAYESFVEHFGKMPINEVNKMYLGQWLEKIQKERDYSARTIVLMKYCFNPFFTYLCDLGVISKNPMAQVKMSRYGHRKNERVYLAESEVQEILERFRAVSPLEIYPITYFQLHTAAYIGEVVKLKWTDVDFEKSTASFPATGNSSDRILTLPPKLIELLKTLPRHNEFVFSRDDGQAWSVVSYYRKFAKVRAKIAYKKNFDSYAFRHTFAYHFLRKGGAITQLQALLGHRSIDMTVFMYGSIAAKNTEKTTPYDF